MKKSLLEFCPYSIVIILVLEETAYWLMWSRLRGFSKLLSRNTTELVI